MAQIAVLDSTIIHKPGGKIKALARGNGRAEGYLISFGNPGDADIEGQFFTANTDIREKFFQDFPVLFHHGLDSRVGLDPIGRIVALNKDSVGWYAQAVLDLHDPFGREVYDLIQTAPFGWSSGSVDHLVVIMPSGEIVVWPLYEGSITPSPMQPHKTTVRALKAMGISPRPKEPVLAEAEQSGPRIFVKASTGATSIMLRTRPSTLAFVNKVLKSAGYNASPRMVRAIAAQCDADDAAEMAAGFDDPAEMDFPEDDQQPGGGAMMDFGDDSSDGMMDFPEDDGQSDGMMDFGDDSSDGMMDFPEDDGSEQEATMGFGDDADEPPPQQMPPSTQARRAASFRKGNEGKKLPKKAPKTTLPSAKGMTSLEMMQAKYISSLEKRMKAFELEEAPGERRVGRNGNINSGATKGGALRNARITDQADMPGAYKAAFTTYLTRGEFAMTESDKYNMIRGQVRYEDEVGSVKGFDGTRGMARVKALNTSNAGSVGFAVPDDFVDELNRNVMVQALTAQECKVRTTTSDTILIPDLTPTDARRAYQGAVTWIGETAANQAESDTTPIALNQINLPIHVMLVSTVSSLSALEDAAFDLQAYITEAFAEMIAIEYDTLIMSGNGQGKLLGILSDTRITAAASTGVSSVSGYVASGATATISDADKIIDMYMHLPPQYKAVCKWFMNSNTAREIMKLKDGVGRYLWGDDHYGLNSGIPNQLLQRPIIFNEFMPDIAAGAFPVVLGVLNRAYTIGKRVEFSVRRFDDSTYASQDQALILGRARLGGQPTLPVGIKVLKVAVS